MLKNEWKSLLKNKILLIVIAAVILIPVIYAGLFLKSMWDPYGNLDKLPVAVVNLDKKADYEGTTLDIGREMTEALKENDSLDFYFVDSAEASRGLANGTYYMVITIPEDFSSNAATLMDAHPKKMELLCETNPGTNYIASKMGESALIKIRDEIAGEVTETYTEAVFRQIAEAGTGMQEAADGAGELKDGIRKAGQGNAAVTANLKKLADSVLTFQNGAETLEKGLKEYTAGVSQVNDGAKTLNNGTASLTAKIPELTGGVNSLNEGVKQYTDGAAKLNANSAQLLAGAESLKSGSVDLTEGLDALKEGAAQYISGANTLADGITQYLAGTGQLSEGAEKLSALENLGQVSAGITELNDAVSRGENSLTEGTKNLEAGLGQLYEKVKTVSESSSADTLKQIASGISQAKTGMENAGKEIKGVENGISEASQEIGQTADSISAAAGEIASAAGVLQGSFEFVSDGFSTAAGITEQCAADANGRIEEANRQIAAANAQIAQDQSSMGNAAAALAALQAGADENGNISAAELDAVTAMLGVPSNSAEGVEGIDAGAYISQINETAASVSSQAAQIQSSLNSAADQMNQTAAGLKAEAETLKGRAAEAENGAETIRAEAEKLEATAGSVPDIPADALAEITSAVKALYDGAGAVNQGAEAVSGGLCALESATEAFPDAAQGIQKLSEGIQAVTEKNSVLEEGAENLKAAGSEVLSGISHLSSGGKTFGEGINALSEGIASYTEGAAELDRNGAPLREGSEKLAEGAKMLTEGAGQLSQGTAALYTGTSRLEGSSQALNSGASKLSEGSGQIHDGAGQLYEGSKELGRGIKELGKGSETLQSSLGKGAGQIREKKADESMTEMFASPVQEKETKMTTVENNGHAMAPYMMSVGLWVGSLAFCLMYPLTEYKGKLKSGTAWWASKASVLYPVALLQGILLIVLLHFIDGFTPAEMTKTVLFACLASAAFTSIMYFFNVALGKVGSFLMLIFMVVQLAGSAGTYPVEISPSFVSKIHRYLPFTYTVDAFRSTIAGGESIWKSVLVLAVITVFFTGLTILQFQFMAREKKKGKKILLDWLEERGVA